MKTHVFLFLFISSMLAGCTAGTPAAPNPSPIMPTVALLSETTSTSTVVISEVSSPTITVVEATATVDSTLTPEPSATAAVLQMEFVGESGQNPVTQQPQQPCQRPQNWVAYTVQRSDTLSSLGQRTGVGWQQIQTANCLAGTTILAGQVLYLPFIPASVPQPGTTNINFPTITIETPPAPNPGDPNLEVVPKQGVAGTAFVLQLDTFASGETVTIVIKTAGTFQEVYRTTVQMSSLGNALVTYQSPVNAERTIYLVEALGAKSASGEFTITAP